VQRRDEAAAALALLPEQPLRPQLRAPVVPLRRLASIEDHHGVLGHEVEGEAARRGQILDGVEPTLLFLRVEEVAVPQGLVVVHPVASDIDGWQARIGAPSKALLAMFGGEAEAVVRPV
jgi:hypothetical protein